MGSKICNLKIERFNEPLEPLLTRHCMQYRKCNNHGISFPWANYFTETNIRKPTFIEFVSFFMKTSYL